MTEKMIIDAYCRIRTIDNTIPDDVLDFMKESSLDALKKQNSHKYVVMQAEGSDVSEGAAVGQRSVDTGVSGGLERCNGGCCDNGTGYCMFCENRL